MKTIDVGLIGWGFMGRTHAHALRAIPLFYPGAGFRPEVRASAPAGAEKARQAAEERATSAVIPTRALAAAARPEIDAVSVCTPNALHEEMVVAALKAGKHYTSISRWRYGRGRPLHRRRRARTNPARSPVWC